MSLTSDVNSSIQSLFLSKVSIASKVTPLLLLVCVEYLSLLVILMNGVEDCPVSCLSNFSFISTLFAKSVASLRLLTLIKVEYSQYGRVFLKLSKICISP